MFQIIDKKDLAPSIKQFVVDAPLVAQKARPGQFIILRIKEGGERIPLTIADYDTQKGTITIVFQEVGKTTKELGTLKAGDYLADFVGPLGKAVEFSNHKKVLGIGGGLGVAPLYPKLKMLHENGAEVISIIGAKTADMLIMEEEIKAVSDKTYVCTDDGSKGRHGFVTVVLKELLEQGEKFDEIIIIGPPILMKIGTEIAKPYNIPIMVSLNPIMIDGTGMCGGCRVTVGGETKFVCVDGPAFDGSKVDFDELMKRLQTYTSEEKLALDKYHSERGACKCHQ
ncbi:MAG: sulfide/dihydroorotate dehydrogenase-like FAD/NAD-binding protein [Tepidanaerobacter acetatoxydans]|jgi:ferredoxin--NADP+ reductase|uniref:Sulfide dehydrogenase subunit beta n=1 Tax=Tepidanaerobacter acetatoxydans (strain DSM 21804 / JCM 16047 / Re1) TaxID=1209989 RepID=F4LU47_TEPAE|nr:MULTISPECIES: sulfide/dihydroorotate dehydrogenase-like FAD/NAD-binding protein [Tepidanaerobacter]AEE90573.1 oxidoreductase FAD/NAD(P)-binding domain protein [Tepidanaerobacter acetatoxydans Re1]NLU11350.1 sulfide/dihydroorotate dehydrogenase-like FAD/NAD-binding protein [Tepidanaerobacter acetatoxydans]CCP25088.1 Sulfide dehydrogenase subunit beta [Tepidanaerobacter acetatoxydans Re1]